MYRVALFEFHHRVPFETPLGAVSETYTIEFVGVELATVTLLTEVKRPLESTVITGIIVALPYVVAVTPVVVKSNVRLSPDASAVMATLPVVLIVNVSALESATSDVPLATIVVNDS